jgi:hypothetical protein
MISTDVTDRQIRITYGCRRPKVTLTRWPPSDTLRYPVPDIPPEKLVAEWRYKPTLRFYPQLDQLGQEFLDQYPDWERTALTLEVRNIRRHRRVHFAFGRCFYEADGKVDLYNEFNTIGNTIGRTCERIGIDRIERIGIRQFFAIDFELSFAALMDKVHAKLFVQDERLTAALGAAVKDVGYVAEMESDDGFKYHLRLGPMLKRQWMEMVPLDPDNFERPVTEESATFKKYASLIPDQFLYIDFDCARIGCTVAEAKECVAHAKRRAQDLANSLSAYVREN